MVNTDELQRLIEQCLEQTDLASQGKYESEAAEKTAALFLKAQMQLSLYIENIELQARLSKNEVDRVEAEKYFDIKTNATGKLTEAGLENAVAKDQIVVEAKKNAAQSESTAKKWNYVMGNLKEGHIFFRNLTKTKGGWE